jgi:hypothetical protein
MQKVQKFIYWACVSSEISHVLCCGLPMLFSLMSLLSALGIIVAMPSGLDALHHVMHDYEVPMIIASGFVLAVGWMLHFVAKRIDCRSTGCAHAPCTPKKKRSDKILFIATALFVFNVTIYFTFHA